MDKAIAEAVKTAGAEDDIEKQVQAALDCPCIADLKEGVCGPRFVDAFSCYIRSVEEEKGADCLPAFQDLQTCMVNNSEHFKDFFTGDDEDDGEDKESRASIADQAPQSDTQQRTTSTSREPSS